MQDYKYKNYKYFRKFKKLFQQLFRHPDIFARLHQEIIKYNATVKPPGNLPPDERANPDNWGHVWVNFGDKIKDLKISA